MKKLIGFQEIADMWAFCDTCIYNCKKRWCPIWKKLEKPDVRDFRTTGFCEKCVHNSPDDQICDHTGWDKRGLKKCQYRQRLTNETQNKLCPTKRKI